MHKLNKLDINKSAGPDGITNIVLKSAKQTLTPYLVYLYRLSVSLGEIPKEWKLAQVVPIYKSGDVQRRENYRPVSLTSTVCKTLERLILDCLQKYIEERCPISDNQFGFRSRRSCASQLISYVDMLSEGLDNNLSIDVIYLDQSKAFDKVLHYCI
jgi:hypothetical protein